LRPRYGRVISSVLENVPQKQKEVASRIIGWVTCAKRPLKWREIEATFSIDYTNSTLAYERGKLREGCKWFCGSLVDLQWGETDPITEAIITLVHETARR
jgi:GPI inositol-deacylase-like protein